ncbi:YbaB/EbfC family nucleoid-associated protein [Saccharopolyspora sp. CA-218241]|uniref:YbaB/EbfC family nucleoid-associated protein n=1 Tax=Saccharopolyspora sp. CA-218241 TaxID=3240027 RepID=UPI003D996762
MGESVSGASERIQEMMRKFEEQAAKADELQEAMQGLQGTASSPDRSVTVTVAPSGALLDLRLTPGAVRHSAAELQQTIMATVREATASAAEQLNETVAPILGDRFDQFQQAFNVEGVAIKPQPADDQDNPAPEPPPAAPQPGPAAAAPPRPKPDAEPEDDDFSDESFLR